MQINKLLADATNFSLGRSKDIEYIVIHYTANNGDSAKGNCNYFKGANRKASAHYFVDDKEICQSVEDKNTAWHCGTRGSYYHKDCRNNNSIGIELCSLQDSNGKFFFDKMTVDNAILLVKMLMKKYNIPLKNVLRHYDITHKICPKPFVDNAELWTNFKEKLKEGEYMKVKRTIEINGVRTELEAINDNGKNYYGITDIMMLLGKKVSYDTKTKITTIS